MKSIRVRRVGVTISILIAAWFVVSATDAK